MRQCFFHPIVLSTFKTTLKLAFFTTIINCFFCITIAWVLTEFRFPGKKILEIAIDIPFALPTSVGGLTLMNVYSDRGWIGSLCSAFGVKIAFTQLGVLFAMVFVSFPLVVRTIQPVLLSINNELKEAAWCLGASHWATFRYIIFPFFRGVLLSGMILVFSRAISEYGSIVLISSNRPRKDLVISVLIFQKLEQYDFHSATCIAVFILIFSFSIFYISNHIQMSTSNRKN
jgi:sulfate transport system permease protein